MSNHQLNLYIHSIDIDKSIITKSANLYDQIWCVLSIDGSDNPIPTPAVQMNSHSTFDYELEFIFKTNPTEACYLYLTLCTFANNSKTDLMALARAKISIEKIPLNGPNAFRIPLMEKTAKKTAKNKKKDQSSKNSEFKQVASILISGVIYPPLSQMQNAD